MGMVSMFLMFFNLSNSSWCLHSILHVSAACSVIPSFLAKSGLKVRSLYNRLNSLKSSFVNSEGGLERSDDLINGEVTTGRGIYAEEGVEVTTGRGIYAEEGAEVTTGRGVYAEEGAEVTTGRGVYAEEGAEVTT